MISYRLILIQLCKPALQSWSNHRLILTQLCKPALQSWSNHNVFGLVFSRTDEPKYINLLPQNSTFNLPVLSAPAEFYIHPRLERKLPTTFNDTLLNSPVYTDSIPSDASWELLFSRDISRCDSFPIHLNNTYTFPLKSLTDKFLCSFLRPTGKKEKALRSKYWIEMTPIPGSSRFPD